MNDGKWFNGGTSRAHYGPPSRLSCGRIDPVGRVSLITFDQFLDAAGVGLAVTVAGERVAATGGFNENFRSEKAGLDVDGRDLENTHADFIHAEPGTFAADDSPVRDLDAGGKEKISAGPPAGLKNFGRHVPLLLADDPW
jgi:hypothetical protein